jgi:hypothetical protein
VDARRWIPPLFFAFALALLPWTVWLTQSLPAHHTTEHWDVVWTGFDIGEVCALLAVAVLTLRRSAWLEAAAATAGTMLLCDAWFDVLLENGVRFWFSVAEAVVIEIPLALLCFWIARDAERFATRRLPTSLGGPPERDPTSPRRRTPDPRPREGRSRAA